MIPAPYRCSKQSVFDWECSKSFGAENDLRKDDVERLRHHDNCTRLCVVSTLDLAPLQGALFWVVGSQG
jgi:hypothetical protein